MEINSNDVDCRALVDKFGFSVLKLLSSLYVQCGLVAKACVCVCVCVCVETVGG